MIVDCHAHVFEHWIGPCGHKSRHDHARALQYMLARTVAPTYRARDGKRVDAKALIKPGARGWDDNAAVEFRVGKNGQLEFTVAGEDYRIQYMPVGMQEMVSPPDFLLAQMVHAGVDRAVLQAGATYGMMNDYNSFAQRQHPDKLTGLMNVPEALAGEPEYLAEIERAHRELGLKGIYYNVEGFSRNSFAWQLDDRRLVPFWEKMVELKLTLCIEPSGGPTYDRPGYVATMAAIGRMVERFPSVPCHIAMSPPVAHFAHGASYEFTPEMTALYKRDNVVMEVMFPITYGGIWDYPYPEAQALVRDMRDKFGAEKLVWGSDMPNVERFCTYKQSLDYVRRYCEFLTAREKDLILGLNAARFYGLASG
jgi:predicted TIM-barrel fold metal-dependent hydrolase